MVQLEKERAIATSHKRWHTDSHSMEVHQECSLSDAHPTTVVSRSAAGQSSCVHWCHSVSSKSCMPSMPWTWITSSSAGGAW